MGTGRDQSQPCRGDRTWLVSARRPLRRAGGEIGATAGQRSAQPALRVLLPEREWIDATRGAKCTGFIAGCIGGWLLLLVRVAPKNVGQGR